MMRALCSELHVGSAVRVEPELTDFRFPDWNAPIDLHERLGRTPAEQTVKGLFIQQILEQARAASGTAPTGADYLAFHDYPMHEWMELLVRCAEITYPVSPVREGLRRLGQMAYPTFAASSVGKVLLGVAGPEVSALLRLVPRISRITRSGGIADVSFPASARAVVHLRDVWDFPDAYHVGVYEGAVRSVGAKGQVKVRMIGAAGADLEVTWW